MNDLLKIFAIALVLSACGKNDSNSNDDDKNDKVGLNRIFDSNSRASAKNFEGKLVNAETAETFEFFKNAKFKRTLISTSLGTCSFEVTGKVDDIWTLDIESRPFVTHAVIMEVDSFKLSNRLIPDSTTNANCLEDFSYLEKDDFEYLYVEFMDDKTIRFHENNPDYRMDEPRTPDTLDEVYTLE
jgi:hypothetical protein